MLSYSSFFGQFLDLYDGRAVRRWGGTLRGELYDDIADGTNFGGTVAFIGSLSKIGGFPYH